MTDHVFHTGFLRRHKPSAIRARTWPAWLPEDVERYLSHTEHGLSIRQVARRDNCHASTVLRQIRRVETRRDDPLIDKALDTLAVRVRGAGEGASEPDKKRSAMGHFKDDASLLSDAADLDRIALRVLRRMSETGSVLAVAEGMETAVVVREGADGSTTRTASVAADAVQALSLHAGIECRKPGKISRYVLTHAGRTKLSALLRQGDGPVSDTVFADQHREMDEKVIGEDSIRRRVRYNAAESPVTLLARRKDKSGAPFLNDALVGAAERLREDFELAQMGPNVTQNWDRFLTAGSDGGRSGAGSARMGASGARDRVAEALRYLGPGLGDVALRCCCYLEGLEAAEKRMGWSARSGKIVLRIALQRLRQFYDTEMGDVLIG